MEYFNDDCIHCSLCKSIYDKFGNVKGWQGYIWPKMVKQSCRIHSNCECCPQYLPKDGYALYTIKEK